MASDWRRYLCGGLASWTAEIATFPIDVTKTRLQLQGQHNAAAVAGRARYTGMLNALRRIPAEEGVAALYKGLSPALLRQATYGTLKMGIYKDVRSKLTSMYGAGLPVDVASAIFAGGFSSAVANPSDVIKVRMQSGANAGKYAGLVDAIFKIGRAEGIAGLWKGVLPNVQRACVVAAVELPTYDTAKRQLIQHGFMDDGIYCHFVASNLAGFFASVASNPIDVMKTRLMNQSTAQSTLDCFRKTVAHEGWGALYKGFIPNYMRLGPWNMVFFMSYEQYARLTGLGDR